MRYSGHNDTNRAMHLAVGGLAVAAMRAMDDGQRQVQALRAHDAVTTLGQRYLAAQRRIAGLAQKLALAEARARKAEMLLARKRLHG